MNKALYICGIVGGGILTYLFLFLAMDPKTTEMAAAVPVPILIAAIVHLVMVYKMWKSLQGGQARMTPGKAVGFLFIPFFNIYWLFQVYPGFATDYNRTLQERNVAARPLSHGLMVAMVVFILVAVPIVNWVVQTIAISKICDAVNALKKP